MAKTTISSIATLTVIFLAITAASAYRTTITTVAYDDSAAEQGGQSEQQCRQAAQPIMACQSYLMDSIRGTMGVWREEFPRCCDELEQVEEGCRCEYLRKTFQQMQQLLEGGLQGKDLEETIQTTRSLAVMCRIPPREFCEIGQSMQLV